MKSKTITLDTDAARKRLESGLASYVAYRNADEPARLKRFEATKSFAVAGAAVVLAFHLTPFGLALTLPAAWYIHTDRTK